MKKIIIGLVGEMACGKETAKKYLESKYGAQSVKFSTMLRDILNRVSLPVTRENMQSLSTVMRKTFGEDLMAKVIAEDVKKIPSEIAVADGVRRETDLTYLRKIDGFYLIRIDAKPEFRYERMVKRNENIGDSEKTFEQFMKEHEAESEQLISSLMKTADYSLNNDGTLDELYRQIDDLIIKLHAH